MEYGIVYLLTNPVMPGLVKIGMTTQEDIDKRMKELYTTGVPVPFECNREFFRIQVEQAKAILELFHHTDVTEEVSDEIENDLTDDDKAASDKAKVKRPPLNYHEMGMSDGDVLVWKDNPEITVTIISDRKVSYNGEEVSLSTLSAQLKGYSVKHISPCPCWLYKGQSLDDIYDKTYPIEEQD